MELVKGMHSAAIWRAANGGDAVVHDQERGDAGAAEKKSHGAFHCGKLSRQILHYLMRVKHGAKSRRDSSSA